MAQHRYHKDDISFGPDVDIDTDKLYDRRGQRVDQAYIDQAIADVTSYRQGRPSLGQSRGASPRVSFRLEPELRDLAQQRATKEGKSLSGLAREAFEHYLRHAS